MPKNQTMDITNLNSTQLKAMIYDESVKMRTSQNNIKIMTEQLVKVITAEEAQAKKEDKTPAPKSKAK
jgi:hypothetical protein